MPLPSFSEDIRITTWFGKGVYCIAQRTAPLVRRNRVYVWHSRSEHIEDDCVKVVGCFGLVYASQTFDTLNPVSIAVFCEDVVSRLLEIGVGFQFCASHLVCMQDIIL